MFNITIPFIEHTFEDSDIILDLGIAAAQGKIYIARYIIEKQYINIYDIIIDNTGDYNALDIFKLIMNEDRNIDTNEALDNALKYGYNKMAYYIITHYTLDLEEALSGALSNGNYFISKLLLQKIPSSEYIDEIVIAAGSGNIKLVEYLYSRGYKPGNETLAFSNAFYNNDLKMAEVLISHGASLESFTFESAAGSSLDVLKFNLDHRPYGQDVLNFLLQWAIIESNSENVAYLQSIGAEDTIPVQRYPNVSLPIIL
jgi:ankyrin repeat protein